MNATTGFPTSSGRIPYQPDLPPPRSCWPDENQLLLLQACLGDADRAASAFAQWSARVDMLKMDHGSNRLMALLFRNLEKHGIRGPHHERLRGNWRYHWYQNKLLLQEFKELSVRMKVADIPVIALKGIPLGLFYYRDMGVRPMSDFDILIEKEKIPQTVLFLRDNGYRPKLGDLDAKIPYINGCGFVKEGGTEIDLHWHVLHDCFYTWSDEKFWQQSIVESYEGKPCRTLCAEDHLLHACAHGMRYNKVPPLRWLVDAWMIVATAGDRLDYERLVFQAEQRQLALPIQKTFDYFERHFSPSGKLPLKLPTRRLRVTFYEKAEYVHRIHPPDFFPSYVPAWFRYLRWRQAGDPRGIQTSFLDFYAKKRKLPGRWAALKHILRVTFKKSALLHLKDWLFSR